MVITVWAFCSVHCEYFVCNVWRSFSEYLNCSSLAAPRVISALYYILRIYFALYAIELHPYVQRLARGAETSCNNSSHMRAKFSLQWLIFSIIGSATLLYISMFAVIWCLHSSKLLNVSRIYDSIPSCQLNCYFCRVIGQDVILVNVIFYTPHI